MKKSLRLLPLTVLFVGCSSGPSGESTFGDPPGNQGASGSASQPTPPSSTGSGSSGGFMLLPQSEAHMAAIQGPPPDMTAVTPDGPVSLGYVPAPVVIPQDAPQYNTAANYPAQFDLRANGKLPPVRDQGGCGSCWTFATFSSSESTLLPNDTRDFSEDHLNNAHGFDIPACNGGNHLMSIAYLSRWSGPVSEADAPYTAKAHAFATQPAPVKHLTEAYILPARTGPLDNDAIKSAVSTYGAIYTSVNWDSTKYNGTNFAYYHPGPGNSNHAVAIVGWNDDFPASKFAKAPPGNGAFLLRNSWGPWFGDAGYFYMSYYDAFVGRENVSFQAFEATTDYDGVYQYDKFGQTSALTIGSGTTYSANIFTAAAETGLQAVSFYTTAPATTVTINVYDAPASSPSDGKLVGTTQTAEAYAGYHTVSVSSLGIKLHAGRKFSVVVSVANGTAKSFVPVEATFPGYSSKAITTAGTGFVSGDGAAWTDTAKTWKANVPIKAFFGKSPNCDDQNACTVDGWDGTQCTHTAADAGTVCRAAAGFCDVPETCDGSGAACPADTFVQAGTTCRAANGDCDVAEVCTGKSGACPTDTFKPQIAICRAATGTCDAAEHCSGAAAACPVDVKVVKGTVCRAKNSLCDVAEACDGVGSNCPDDKAAPKGTVCRVAAGGCDVAETCDGLATSCPVDGFLSSGTVCRATAGDCDVAETCSGASSACPVNGFATFGTVCRAAVGACDVAEVCSGKLATCPANAIRPAGYQCSSAPVKACNGKVTTCL
jgi:C1A family cysteine protease